MITANKILLVACALGAAVLLLGLVLLGLAWLYDRWRRCAASCPPTSDQPSP